MNNCLEVFWYATIKLYSISRTNFCDTVQNEPRNLLRSKSRSKYQCCGGSLQVCHQWISDSPVRECNMKWKTKIKLLQTCLFDNNWISYARKSFHSRYSKCLGLQKFMGKNRFCLSYQRDCNDVDNTACKLPMKFKIWTSFVISWITVGVNFIFPFHRLKFHGKLTCRTNQWRSLVRSSLSILPRLLHRIYFHFLKYSTLVLTFKNEPGKLIYFNRLIIC